MNFFLNNRIFYRNKPSTNQIPIIKIEIEKHKLKVQYNPNIINDILETASCKTPNIYTEESIQRASHLTRLQLDTGVRSKHHSLHHTHYPF